MRKWSTFHRMLLLVFLLTVPGLILYNYSNQVSVNVITDQVQSLHLNQLLFLAEQIETNVNQLSESAITLNNDPSTLLLENLGPSSRIYNQVEITKLVQEKIRLQNAASNWSSEISISLPSLGIVVDSFESEDLSMKQLQNDLKVNWHYVRNNGDGQFVRDLVQPIHLADNLQRAKSITRVKFSAEYIRNLLQNYKGGMYSELFLYKQGFPLLDNGETGENKRQNMMNVLQSGRSAFQSGSNNGFFETSLEGKPYFVSYAKIDSLDWILVEYAPMENILHPIRQTNLLYYVFMSVLIILSLLSVLFIYKNIQIPIRKLLIGVQGMKRGNYAVRITGSHNNEFDFLFQRFNQMVEEIQKLIGTVFEERLRSREAKLKQLQAQINPHFLYNCLAFMKSMARLQRNEQIVKMCLHLGNYYRYVTRNEKQEVTLQQELDLIRDYLEIQSLKSNRISYEIQVPETMRELIIPQLLLQPVVENCIEHGIDPMEGTGLIRLTGEITDNDCTIIIEDNGMGMTTEAMKDLENKLKEPLQDEIGLGIWNINQRLFYHFGEGSGIHLEPSKLGGLKVILTWRKTEEGESNGIANRR